MPSPVEPLSFLRSMAPFSPWETSQPGALTDLAERSEIWSFVEGDQICFPDETLGGPVWVVEGCLVVVEAGTPRYVGVRERLRVPGGLEIKGQTSGFYLKVPEASWQAWLRRWPDQAEELGEPASPPLPKALAKSPLILANNERLVELFRKSPLFLARRAALPSLFFVLFLAFGLLLNNRFGSVVPLWGLWLLPGVGMLVTGLLIGLVSWEWSASVLAVTSHSLIVRQIDVWLHRSDFEKVALERIREILFRKQGWMDALLHLVTLEIEGDSPKGRLVFPGLTQNSRFLSAMETLKAAGARQSLSRPVIRQALAARAGGARAPVLVTQARPEPSRQPRGLSWRVEQAGGVWFRRHPWQAWNRCLPWLGWFALVVFLCGVAVGFWPRGLWSVTGVGFLAALAPLGRIVWEVWDWAGDRLSIQGGKIILEHRRPLGFGEVRQEGGLDSVEQVGVRKGSLVALIFDFGTVTVSLGASEPLVFDHAHHPEWVQNEIFHRRTLLARGREEQEARTRLEEVSEILDTWDEARKADYFFEKKRNAEKEDS